MNKRLDAAWLDLHATIDYSGLSKSSIYKKMSEGQIEGRKFGKKLLISKDSVDRMFSSLPRFESKLERAA